MPEETPKSGAASATSAALAAMAAMAPAGAQLTANDARLAEADRLLFEAVRQAHLVAAECRHRLAAVQGEIDAAVERRPVPTAAAGRDFGRLLLAKNNEISQIVAAARAESEAKAVVLHSLAGEYRSIATP